MLLLAGGQAWCQNFDVDLKTLENCRTHYLQNLASSEEERMLIIYTAKDKYKLGDVGVYANFKFRGKENVVNTNMYTSSAPSNTAVSPTEKAIYKLDKNILKNDVKLNIIFTNYNELLYSINKSTTSFDVEFAKRDLLSMLNEQNTDAENSDLNALEQRLHPNQIVNHKNLLNLYIAINSHLTVLKNRDNVDRCMLADYISKLGTTMSGIPSNLSSFILYVDRLSANLDLDGDPNTVSDDEKMIRAVLSDLKTLYTLLYNLAKAPVPDFGDRVADADVEQIDVSMVSLETGSEVSSRSDRFTVLNGWRFNTSIPFILHGLTNYAYSLEDARDANGNTVKTILRDEDNEPFVSTAVGAQFNLYPNTYHHMALPVISAGIATDTGQKNTGTRYFAGLGVIFKNKRYRLGVHGGYIYGTVLRLERGYEEGGTYTLANNEIPTRTEYKGSGFLSISLWLPETKGDNDGQ